MQGMLLEAMFTANVEHLVTQVRTPTLVLHARQDPYVPFELGREVALRLPDAEFVTFDSTSPAVWQQREIVLPELRKFVRAPQESVPK